jgi:uncharacterized phiE125 gp8 family phage protein
MALTVVDAPDEMPISLNEAKKHLRVSYDDEDSLIEGFIAAATRFAETFTGRQLCTATLKWSGCEFPCELPRPPFQTVLAVEYLDTAGTLTTLPTSYYLVDPLSEPSPFRAAFGYVFPIVYPERSDAVRVTYTAGYGSAADVPATIKQAMLMLVGNWWENREAMTETSLKEVPMAVASLLWSERLVTVA